MSQQPDVPDNAWALDTLAVRAGTERTPFGEHSEGLFMTSSFVFKSAAEAAARFSNQEPGNVYSRFTNPTVTMFERRLAALEGGEACIATSSGMSAILTMCLGLLQAGDHIVASAGLFGASVQLFNTLLGKFGITTTYASTTDVSAWRAALRPNTRLLFVESPSNPTMEIADIAALAIIAREGNALLAVDNCFCTPILQRPIALGADIVIHSATKYLDGQGRVLGGAIVSRADIIRDRMLPVLRTAGPSLSPFNAWVLLKGLETLGIRMERQSANALTLAQRLAGHPHIARVLHPWLASHPQHALARRQQTAGGAILTFEVRGDTPQEQRAAAWRVIDSTRLASITANLGDTRTTITHPATTTHGRISPEARAAAGITEGMVRVAVGLEHPDDLAADLERGLS
ncbi:MAG TPA: O-succinylhomoserine sulfhydrylase [Burkholderiaceae bacterium]|nr:O-succinylhomoserine sulfhydrylase [Burkholderiaceae bacterium]